MRIAKLYSRPSEPLFSLEFFTPKTEAGRTSLFSAIGRLKAVHPTFVSVTCGAAGTTRERTADLAIEIQRECDIATMAHLVCTGTTKDELGNTLRHMDGQGIKNILALRGDPPRGEPNWAPTPGGLRYANELISLIKKDYDFSVGGACYPETHHEAATAEADLVHLKGKVDAGAEFLITQLFFDNDAYWRFVERARTAGISVPIIPGVMPVISLANLRRIASLSPGTAVPQELETTLEAAQNDNDALDAGVSFAAAQCRALLERGAPGIHFYTLNKSKATLRTIERIGA